MIRSKNAWIWITAGFTVIQIVFAHFIQNPPFSTANAWLSVLSIFSCFCYVLLAFERKPLKIIMLVAASATLVSDLLLTELVDFEGEKLAAMCSFCVVQTSYFIRLYRNHKSKKVKKLHLVVRAGLCMVGLLAAGLVLQDKNNALSTISVFYFCNLIVNLIFAFAQIKKSILLPLGLLLFACCDLVVGLSEMEAGFIPVPEKSFLYSMIHSGVNLAWIFYVPSQTLLAVSVHDEKTEE